MVNLYAKSYLNHLQCLLTHRIIKENKVSRVKAAKLAKRILKYVDPIFVRYSCTYTNIQQRLIIQHFNAGRIAGWYRRPMPKHLANIVLDIAYPESR